MQAIKLPEGPKSPLWVQKVEWVTNPLQFMESCAQEYGDIFTARVGRKSAPLVFVNSPQGIKEIFTTDPKKLDAGKSTGIKFSFLGQQSLITLEGEAHQRQRKLLTPPFHGERMRTYGEIITNITEQETKHWIAGKPFCLQTSLQIISLKVILQTVFGLYEGERYEKLHQLLIERLNISNSFISTCVLYFSVLQQDIGSLSVWGKFINLKQEIDQLIYAEINERHSNPDSSGSDILSLMMSARDEGGQPMSDVELRDELLTLLVAGQETVATALAWAFYWIHRHPEVQQKLHQELKNLDNNFDINTISKLPYLNASISETLRLSPPVPIAFQRLVKSSVKILGYELPPGTFIAPAIYLTHHRPDIYPNPKQFKPERFLDQQFSPYEYLPFGGGNRRCIGMAFAQFEMKIILAKILFSWQLSLADDKIEIPVRRGLLIAPRRGVQMVAKPIAPQN